jgi:hypothetical protein
MSEDKKSVLDRQPQPEIRMARATVERGRTVVVPHPTKRITAKYTDEGKPVIVPVLQHFGPGEEVELPIEEVILFRKLGYLVDPTRKIIPTAGQNQFVHPVTDVPAHLAHLAPRPA